MAYQRKTEDEWQLQADYGYGDGWEVLTSEYTRKEIIQRKREYQEAQPENSYRIKCVRIPRNDYARLGYELQKNGRVSVFLSEKDKLATLTQVAEGRSDIGETSITPNQIWFYDRKRFDSSLRPITAS